MKRLVQEADLLFGDRLAPITSNIGFLQADHILAAQTFCDWLEPIMQKARGVTFTQQLVSGKLEDVLALLLPLTSVERRRYLFVPTTSSWTAFFDNGHYGTDVFSKVSRLSKLLECKGLRVATVPETKEGEFKDARGRYGAVILEVYGNKESVLNYLRAICLINDGGKWDFSQSGTPFLFEDTESYSKHKIKQRFTFEMLKAYTKELGLSPFEEDFYLPPGNNQGVLVEQQGPSLPTSKEYTLEEVRRTTSNSGTM